MPDQVPQNAQRVSTWLDVDIAEAGHSDLD